MRLLTWPEFTNRWMWLFPALVIFVTAAVLWSSGVSWWSALLAAVLLVCPVLMLWGAIQVAIDQRRSRRRPGA
jgi:Ca2+/Na+ antiporter